MTARRPSTNAPRSRRTFPARAVVVSSSAEPSSIGIRVAPPQDSTPCSCAVAIVSRSRQDHWSHGTETRVQLQLSFRSRSAAFGKRRGDLLEGRDSQSSSRRVVFPRFEHRSSTGAAGGHDPGSDFGPAASRSMIQLPLGLPKHAPAQALHPKFTCWWRRFPIRRGHANSNGPGAADRHRDDGMFTNAHELCSRRGEWRGR